MRALPLLSLLIVVVSTTACAGIHGSGIKLTEARKIADFTQIEVGGGVTLEVKRGPTSLTIEGDDNIVPLYSTEVREGRLVIRRKGSDWLSTQRKLLVKVTTPQLERLDASGGVDVTLENVAAPKFAVELSGGVELSAPNLDLESLDLEASGGVNVAMSGQARAAKLSLSGGVGIKAKELQVAQVALDASGGCNVDITAKESVTGEASGGVDLTVHGNPPKSRVHTSGGADVHRKSFVDSMQTFPAPNHRVFAQSVFNQGDANGSTVVQDYIGTPYSDYIRFTKITTEQLGQDGSQRDFSALSETWGIADNPDGLDTNQQGPGRTHPRAGVPGRGEEDRRTPPAHAEAMRKALRSAGNPPESVSYEGEGHGWLKTENQLDFARRLEAFLARHLKADAPALSPAPPQRSIGTVSATSRLPLRSPFTVARLSAATSSEVRASRARPSICTPGTGGMRPTPKPTRKRA